jgi:hypothetical protein
MRFHDALAIGKAGETHIARWLNARGNHVLPVYEKIVNEFKGPVLYRPDGSQAICPDLLVLTDQGIAWIEAKHKSAFTWSRRFSDWNTGIDLHHYKEYIQVQEDLKSIPVWLMFLHEPGSAKDTPDGKVSPSGLFMASLEHLRMNECHRHENHGKHGMVYWRPSAFTHHIPLNDFYKRGHL